MLCCCEVVANARDRIPRIQLDKTVQPYVQEVNGVATLDKSKTVPEQMKKLSETIRTVEQKGSKSKVSRLPIFTHCFPCRCNEENLSQALLLTQFTSPSWATLLP